MLKLKPVGDTDPAPGSFDSIDILEVVPGMGGDVELEMGTG